MTAIDSPDILIGSDCFQDHRSDDWRTIAETLIANDLILDREIDQLCKGMSVLITIEPDVIDLSQL